MWRAVILSIIGCSCATWTAAPGTLGRAVAEAERVDGRVFLPAGTYAEHVTVSGNVTITGAPGAVWRGCGGSLLRVAAGSSARVSGVRFEDACAGNGTAGVDFEEGASGRVERCAFETDVGVRARGSHADARHNYWGAPDGPAVSSSVSTGGRPAGAAGALRLGARARVEWAPFSTTKFHTAHARVFAVWPAQAGEACPCAGSVVGVLSPAVLEFSVTSDADPSCAGPRGRRALHGDAVRWTSVRLDGGSCLREGAARALYRVDAGGEAAHSFHIAHAPASGNVTVTATVDALNGPLAPENPTDEVRLVAVAHSYQLRGAMTYKGDCISCFVADMRDRMPSRRFSRLDVAEDGTTLYFRAETVLPCTKRSASLAFQV